MCNRVFYCLLTLTFIHSSHAVTQHKPSDGDRSGTAANSQTRDFNSSTLKRLAKAAQCAGDMPLTNTSNSPPASLKCAEQASAVLQSVGLLKNKIDGVEELVKHLKSPTGGGWVEVESKTPIKGAIAFTHPAITGDPRSHIGIVNEEGCIVNNASFITPGAGVMSEAGPPGSSGCGSSNKSWAASVTYLVPPDAAGGLSEGNEGDSNTCPVIPNNI